MALKQRIADYKSNEADYFIADIYKGGITPEKHHDLTWKNIQQILKKAKHNEKVSRVEVWVEDWDGEDDDLFKYVQSMEKIPSKWVIDLVTHEVRETAWK